MENMDSLKFDYAHKQKLQQNCLREFHWNNICNKIVQHFTSRFLLPPKDINRMELEM